MLLLGVDVGVEVRSPGLDGGLDGLQAVAPLLHVALDLPCELDLVTDVQVDAEVVQLAHALVVEGVEALQHHDLRTRVMSESTVDQPMQILSYRLPCAHIDDIAPGYN